MQKTTCQKTFIDSIKDNLKHALPEAFYIGISYSASRMVAAGEQPGNFIASKYLGPLILFANTYARLSTINAHEASHDAKVKAFEDTLAQGIINAGVYVTTSVMLTAAPAVALPVLSTFIASEVLLRGDNAPIDYIHDAIADVLHFAHAGELIDWIF